MDIKMMTVTTEDRMFIGLDDRMKFEPSRQLTLGDFRWSAETLDAAGSDDLVWWNMAPTVKQVSTSTIDDELCPASVRRRSNSVELATKTWNGLLLRPNLSDTKDERTTRISSADRGNGEAHQPLLPSRGFKKGHTVSNERPGPSAVGEAATTLISGSMMSEQDRRRGSSDGPASPVEEDV